MIHIICLKFGTKYGSEYVNKLYKGILRNTTKNFLFTCFTDNPLGIDNRVYTQPIPFNTGDWYSKIGLYNKTLYNQNNRILYFDLDTVITGDLNEILKYEGDFIILRDFYRKEGFGSGLQMWRPPAVHHMWKNYTRGNKCRGGDQGWPEIQYPHADIWQEMYPGKVISYKVHVSGKGKLRGINYTNYQGNLKSSSIVCFHGKPLPHEVKEPWMEKHWV